VRCETPVGLRIGAARKKRGSAQDGAATVRYEVNLGRRPGSPAEARRALADLADHLSERRLADARLLVSELVTNALRHAPLGETDVITLVLQADEQTLRIEVRDPGPGFELIEPPPDPTRASGWGLYLVGELADRWGVDRGRTTCVWFELDREAV
jgi:anti-sigma regulatory factor (Ser/Thr protein kinase)